MNDAHQPTSVRGALRLERRIDGTALLIVDVPDQAVNTLTTDFLSELGPLLDEVERDSSIIAVVVISGKQDGFVAGADLKLLRELSSAEVATEVSRRGQLALDRIESSQKPFVAAISGACLGGGLELALACHGRVASNDKKTRLGLPEVQLGLLPGLGGTQRLPALVGVRAALDLMLTGKQLDARRARRLGLVDAVVDKPALLGAAARRALSLAQSPPKARSRLSTEALTEAALTGNLLGRKLFFREARKKLLEKTHGNYPAPERILTVVENGIAHGRERGYWAEANAFGELTATSEARELINIFFATTELKKDTGLDDPSVSPAAVQKVGVLGAGLMGAGIAFVTITSAGLPVRMKDRDDSSLAKGLAHVRELLDEGVKRRRYSEAERSRLLAQVTASVDYSGFRDAELVIEAVFEDLSLKQRVLQDIEREGHPRAIFASNTSSLPIASIAEAASHPDRVIGMHYFSPVQKMPLLEVIVTEKTAPWVTATVVAVGKQQGKTVIVVRDGPGFYTSRILAPYMNEASHLVAEGVAVEKIDEALVGFGFPVGPITLLDEVGIDVGAKVAKVLYHAFGDRMKPPAGVDRLLDDQRLGRKNRRGFYVYEAEGRKSKGGKRVDPSVYSLLGATPHADPPAGQIAQRCVLMMVNEAVRCLEQGILRSPRDGDIGAVFGLGFPPFRGGPFRYADVVGAAEIVRRLRAYAADYGSRFEPAALLVSMAESNRTFYEGTQSSGAPQS